MANTLVVTHRPTGQLVGYAVSQRLVEELIALDMDDNGNRTINEYDTTEDADETDECEA